MANTSNLHWFRLPPFDTQTNEERLKYEALARKARSKYPPPSREKPYYEKFTKRYHRFPLWEFHWPIYYHSWDPQHLDSVDNILRAYREHLRAIFEASAYRRRLEKNKQPVPAMSALMEKKTLGAWVDEHQERSKNPEEGKRSPPGFSPTNQKWSALAAAYPWLLPCPPSTCKGVVYMPGMKPACAPPSHRAH